MVGRTRRGFLSPVIFLQGLPSFVVPRVLIASLAEEHRTLGASAQLLGGMWNLPKPVSPALAGKFLAPVPGGKSQAQPWGISPITTGSCSLRKDANLHSEILNSSIILFSAHSFSLKTENIFRHHSVLDLDWKNEPRLWILFPPFWYRPPQSFRVKRLRGRTIVMTAKGSGPYWSSRSHIFKNYWCWGEETASLSGRTPRGCDPLAFLLLFCRKSPF